MVCPDDLEAKARERERDRVREQTVALGASFTKPWSRTWGPPANISQLRGAFTIEPFWKDFLLSGAPLSGGQWPGTPAACQTCVLSDDFDESRLKVHLNNNTAAGKVREAGTASSSSPPWAPRFPLLLAGIRHGCYSRCQGQRHDPEWETVSFKCWLALNTFLLPNATHRARST